MLSRSFYWMVFLALAAIAVAGFLFIEPPQPDNVEIEVLQQFYRGQSIWAAVIGVAVGLIAGLSAPAGVFHQARDRAKDYDGRVAKRGFWSGLIATLVAIAGMTIAAVVTSIEPLAPLQKAELTVFSGRAAVVFAIAAAITLVVYATATRTRAWGGQYSLLKRF